MQKVSKQQGFTLIELIIVIVLLGILAVTAAPKFLNLQDDARDSTLEGFKGALETAASVVNGKALIQNKSGTAQTPVTVNIGNGTVSVVNGYPEATSANISALMDFDASGFGVQELASGTGVLIYSTGFADYSTTAPTATDSPCSVEYTESTATGVRPVIEVHLCIVPTP